MKFILAEKKEMTQKFAENGDVIPVTRVLAQPCTVTQVKDIKNDGYTAVQLGFGLKKKLSKPIKGHLKNLGSFRYLKEFRVTDDEGNKITVGNKITAKTFTSGDIVKVTGVSKGKGFQGVVKRHGFSGSPASHGHKDQLRMPGSIGATGPAHVFKGTKMPGRMGGNQVTITNLEIVEINPETNEIFIKGAVPGARNNLLLISGIGDIIIETEKKVEPKETKEVPTSAEGEVGIPTESVGKEPAAEKVEEKKEKEETPKKEEKSETKPEVKVEQKEVPTSAESEVGKKTDK